VKYAWPLIRDQIGERLCLVSGDRIEISPHLPPMELFGSYYDAIHRLFMSATVTDDSFLVKGLRLTPETVSDPLLYKPEKWSGEKMMLIPSLIDESLTREAVLAEHAKPRPGRPHGVVALTPSFKVAEEWAKAGAVVAKPDTIELEVEKLHKGERDKVLVVAGRYDGIDLPDETCRILLFDSKPHVESLVDRYEDDCRANSIVAVLRTTRTVEQGLGRSVRGEKDYCVVLLLGPELVKMLRLPSTKKHFSEQTRAQIEIALQVVEIAKGEVEGGAAPMAVLNALVAKCLDRDVFWKRFYAEEMDKVGGPVVSGKMMDIYQRELTAELTYRRGDPAGAVSVLQKLLDELVTESSCGCAAP
jgi:hypothetical protein